MLKLRAGERRWGDYRKSSSTVLNKVRLQLQGRFTSTAIGRDRQAVVISFAGGHRVDVVPAFYGGQGPHGYPIYQIPDGGGGWMDTSPQAHNSYIKRENARSLGKLKNVAKLIKFWRTRRKTHVPLNSFYLELLLAEEGVCLGAKSYERCLHEAFALLAGRRCRALRDPLGISDPVPATNTDAKRRSVQKAVELAAGQCYRALAAEDKGREAEASRLWHLVFKLPYRKR